MRLYRYELREDNSKLLTFEVIRETKYYYIIYKDLFGEKKVSKNAVRSYAYDTKEKAAKNFVFRIKKYMRILKSRLSNAEQGYLNFKRISEEEGLDINSIEVIEKNNHYSKYSDFGAWNF